VVTLYHRPTGQTAGDDLALLHDHRLDSLVHRSVLAFAAQGVGDRECALGSPVDSGDFTGFPPSSGKSDSARSKPLLT